MELEKKRTEIEWYDNPLIVTNIIIGLIAIIIILSQSFAINNNLSTQAILRSIINHNSIYLIVLVYFVALKTNIGKKYFDFLNIFLIILYFLTAITSVLTLFQSFSLESLIGCLLQIVLFVYLFHTLLRRTRVWKDFHLKKSPFNEIKNDSYFYIVMILAIILLAIDLIATTTFDGTVLALLDAIYIILFARYVYLYGCFLDNKEKKITTTTTSVEEIKEKVELVKDKLDEVVDDIQDTVEESINTIVEKVDDIQKDKKVVKDTRSTTKKTTKKSTKKTSSKATKKQEEDK